MDLELTIEEARELERTLRACTTVFRDALTSDPDHRVEDEKRCERLETIADRVGRLLSTPVAHHDPFV